MRRASHAPFPDGDILAARRGPEGGSGFRGRPGGHGEWGELVERVRGSWVGAASVLKAAALSSDGYRVRAPGSSGRAIVLALSMAVVTSTLAGFATARADTTVVGDAQDATLGPDIASVEAGHGRHDRVR